MHLNCSFKINKKTCVFVSCCLFFAITTAMHFRGIHKYMLDRLASAQDRVSQGKTFHNAYDKRSEFMDLAIKHIKNSKGIFARYAHIKKTHIGDIANVAFLANHFYPIPVFYLDNSFLKQCDYIITEKYFGQMWKLLKEQKEEGHFQEIAQDGRYVIFKRIKTAQ